MSPPLAPRMPETVKLEGKSDEGPVEVVLADGVVEWSSGPKRQVFLPRELPHVQLGRESLLTAVLAAVAMTGVAAFWLWKQPELALDVCIFGAEIAALGWFYFAGAWLLQKSTLWFGNGRNTRRVVLSRWQHARAQRLADWVAEQRTAEGLKIARQAPTSLFGLLLADLRALRADDAALREQYAANPLAKGPLSTFPRRRRRAAIWNLTWVVAVPIAFSLAFTRMMFTSPATFALGGFVIWSVVLRISLMASATLLPRFDAWLDGAD